MIYFSGRKFRHFFQNGKVWTHYLASFSNFLAERSFFMQFLFHFCDFSDEKDKKCSRKIVCNPADICTFA